MAKKLNIQTLSRSLTSLLEMMRKGSIQVPGFQRDFVWDRKDVKKLFDSIVHGYPIGTVFLWKPEDQTEKIEESVIGAYRVKSNSSNQYYVLDGYQRLSTLFCCLQPDADLTIEPEGRQMINRLFELYYDAKNDEFVYLSKKNGPKCWQFPLQVMLVASNFRKYSREHLERNESLTEEDKEFYLDRADRVSARFLDYQITCTEINGANINQAAEIFSRINSAGTKVSMDWMVHALSYDEKSGFNLAYEIDKLVASLQIYHFDTISRNTIFRCLQSSFGKPFFDQDNIENLAKQQNFKSVIVKEAIPAIKAAVRFLYEELHLITNKLLPYGIQLVFCTEFFRRIPEPTDMQKGWLMRWFWITTNESFFTISSLADQRQEYYNFVAFIEKTGADSLRFSDDDPLRYHEINDFPDFPVTINLKGVRSCALALFVINNLYSKCPDLMANATYMQSFAESNIDDYDFGRGVRNTLFTDVESRAYQSIRYVGLDKLFDDDKRILEASFFSPDENYKPTLYRQKRMEIAEREFYRQLK